MKREELSECLDALLDARRFKDYCPNGLQVEGRQEVCRLVAGVTASQALIDAAVERGADAILVHHGWFWRGEDGRVTGIRKTRLSALLAHDINLFAYHLPLDSHPELGNNAQLAMRLGWVVDGRFGEQDIGWLGHLPEAMTLAGFAQGLGEALGRVPQVIGAERQIRRVAWCTGGAQSAFEEAIALGVDAYVSGEISEPTFHLAQESGVAYLAAGHHATERFGVQAVSQWLAETHGLECEFVDIDNPV